MTVSVELKEGDCLAAVRGLPDNGIDSVVTDPPYALVSVVKRFGGNGAAPAGVEHAGGAYARASAGFMGKKWDTGETAFAVEFWAEVLRVLKPGGHVAAFSGTRTYHRLACAVEDAGFEIRDQLAWVYGTGFPKSHDAGNGWGTALKPAWEPICLARKPLSEKTVAANVLRWGCGAINVDGCRVENADYDPSKVQRQQSNRQTWEGGESSGFAADHEQQTYNAKGRFPANLCHDGSEEVLAAFPDSKGQQGVVDGNTSSREVYGEYGPRQRAEPRGDSGSAARFFYSAKASKADRANSKHPTVKPVKLMQWLVRLITPPGGVTLDPFAGSGTTGEAAFLEGCSAILVEREAEYQADIARRLLFL